MACYTYLPIEDLREKASLYGPVRDLNLHRPNEILRLSKESVMKEPWKSVVEKFFNQMNKTSGTMMDDQEFIGNIRGFDRNAIIQLNDSTALAEWNRLFDSTPDYVFLNAKRKWGGGPFFGFPNSRCWMFRLFFVLLFFFVLNSVCIQVAVESMSINFRHQ